MKITKRPFDAHECFRSYSPLRDELIEVGYGGMALTPLYAPAKKREIVPAFDRSYGEAVWTDHGIVCRVHRAETVNTKPILPTPPLSKKKGKIQRKDKSPATADAPAANPSLWRLPGDSSSLLFRSDKDFRKVKQINELLGPCWLYPAECENLVLLIRETDVLRRWPDGLWLCRLDPESLEVLWTREVKNAENYCVDALGEQASVIAGGEMYSIALQSGEIMSEGPVHTGRGVKGWVSMVAISSGYILAGHTSDFKELVICHLIPGEKRSRVVFKAAYKELLSDFPVAAVIGYNNCNDRPNLSRLVWLPEISRVVFEVFAGAEPGSGGDELIKGLFALDPFTGDCLTCMTSEDYIAGNLLQVGPNRVLYDSTLITFQI